MVAISTLQIYELEMVQRRAARFVMQLYSQQSVTAMLKELEWEERVHRKLKAQVTMCYKISNTLVRIPSTQLMVGPYNTRSRAKGGYRQLGTQYDYLKYSFFSTAFRAWNMLPDHVTNSASLEQFNDGLCKTALGQDNIYKY